MSNDPAQRAVAAANNRVAILDAGAQYGKVISIWTVLFRFDMNADSDSIRFGLIRSLTDECVS